MLKCRGIKSGGAALTGAKRGLSGRNLLWHVLLLQAFTALRPVHASLIHRYRRTAEDNTLLCLLSLSAVMNQDETSSEFYSCALLVNHTHLEGTFDIDPPLGILDEYQDELRRGQDVYLELSDATLTEDTVVIWSDDSVRVVEPPARRRRLSRRPPTTGSFLAVMIRITANDAEPDFSADQLYDYLFESQPNVKRQIELCSGGALTMRPDPNLRVSNVHLDLDALGKSNKALMNLAEVRFNTAYGAQMGGLTIRDYTDTVLFVLPPGTGSWAAFATVAGKSVRCDLAGEWYDTRHVYWRRFSHFFLFPLPLVTRSRPTTIGGAATWQH
jgi:hypothetical protein